MSSLGTLGWFLYCATVRGVAILNTHVLLFEPMRQFAQNLQWIARELSGLHIQKTLETFCLQPCTSTADIYVFTFVY